MLDDSHLPSDFTLFPQNNLKQCCFFKFFTDLCSNCLKIQVMFETSFYSDTLHGAYHRIFGNY